MSVRCHLISDLHQECGWTDIPVVDCDVILAAGDVHTGTNGAHWLIERLKGGPPVVYIMGNHEGYGHSYPAIIDKIRDACKGTNVHFLENESFDIGGYHIFGATLWTDLALLQDPVMAAMTLQYAMNDYNWIRNSDNNYKKLHPTDTQKAHFNTIQHLREFLMEHDPRKTVVMTHHVPSLRSLESHYQQDPISAGYASNLDGLIEQLNPLLWCHGHTHSSSDYMIGNTRILANPRGYPFEGNRHNGGFKPDLVIDLDTMVVEHKMTPEQFQLVKCPKCGRTDSMFYINGQWACHSTHRVD